MNKQDRIDDFQQMYDSLNPKTPEEKEARQQEAQLLAERKKRQEDKRADTGL
jgi:hypothetical protein